MATSGPYKVMDIICDAMSQIGAIQADEAPQPFEQNLCLRRLNFMIDRWSSMRLVLRSYTSFNYPLTAGKFSYTVGPVVGVADWVGAKPLRIGGGATIQDSSGTKYPVDQVTKAEWDEYTDQAINTNRPESFVYDPGAAQQGVTGQGVVNPSIGTLFFYMTPDSSQSYTFFFEADCYLVEFTSVDQTVTFESAYYEALYFGLAARIFRDFNEHQKTIPDDIVKMAASTLRTIKELNARMVVARVESPSTGRGGVFNVYDNVYVGGNQ